MNESPITLSRRGALRALAGGGLALVAAGVAGCGSDQPPQPTGNLVMIIRNAEETGAAALTDAGQARARALADLFSPAQRMPKAGLDRPAAIYVCASGGQRVGAVDTVAPLAQRLHLPVISDFDGRQAGALVSRIVTQPGPALICAGNDEIPKITQAFQPVNASPDEWPSTRFDVVWVLTQTTDGWIFSQVPEQVLPGDQPSAI